VALVSERTIPAELPPLVIEVSSNFFGLRMPHGQRDWSLVPYFRLSTLDPLLLLRSSSSIVLTRLSGLRSRPTTSQKIWKRRESNPALWICSQDLWPLDHKGGRLKVERYTNCDEMEMIWKETIVVHSRYYSSISLERLKKSKKTFGQDIRYRVQDSNRAPGKYKAKALLVCRCAQSLFISAAADATLLLLGGRIAPVGIITGDRFPCPQNLTTGP
jgi:hypothetical protein